MNIHDALVTSSLISTTLVNDYTNLKNLCWGKVVDYVVEKLMEMIVCVQIDISFAEYRKALWLFRLL